MKIRLYRGPFDGKIINDWDGRRECYITGPKKMTREQRWKHLSKATTYGLVDMHVSAVYVATNFVHPDGSIFYEWERPRGGR